VNPKKLLRDFLNVFATTRRNGHTTSLIRGEAAAPAIVIVADFNQKEQFKRDHPHVLTCSLSQMDSLVASKCPIIIDLYAVASLVSGAIRMIEHTETELAKTQGDRDVFERKFDEMKLKFLQSEFIRIEISKQEQSSTRCALFLREQLAEARAELQDWKDAAESAENPHPDEVHCTCVPLLQAALAEARKELGEKRREASDAKQKYNGLAALVGTIRQMFPIPLRNVSDIEPWQHSQEIGAAIDSEKDQLAEARKDTELTSRIAEEMTKQRDRLEKALIGLMSDPHREQAYRNAREALAAVKPEPEGTEQ
jgi:hypothetical protein